MVILVVFNSFDVVKNLKKPDLVPRQKPPFYTTYGNMRVIGNLFSGISYAAKDLYIFLEMDTAVNGKDM